jgi:hypothetical protein
VGWEACLGFTGCLEDLAFYDVFGLGTEFSGTSMNTFDGEAGLGLK